MQEIDKTKPAISKEEAKKLRLDGWNIRCNYCGNYGAKWMHTIMGAPARREWGALALCPEHYKKIQEAVKALQDTLSTYRKINFEQE